MKVYVTASQLFCSRACAAERDPGDTRAPQLRAAEVREVTLPRRPANPVLDLLLGRACCDACGDNLEDLAAGQQNRLVALVRDVRGISPDAPDLKDIVVAWEREARAVLGDIEGVR